MWCSKSVARELWHVQSVSSGARPRFHTFPERHGAWKPRLIFLGGNFPCRPGRPGHVSPLTEKELELPAIGASDRSYMIFSTGTGRPFFLFFFLSELGTCPT